jgi:hypothetical protein
MHAKPLETPALERSASRELIVADAHVHFHSCFPVSAFLSAAWEGLCRQAGSEPFRALLLLTESAGDDWFGSLAARADDESPLASPGEPAWEVRRSTESESLQLRGPDDQKLLVVAGRQIVSAEHLEVLAIGTDRGFVDGDPLAEVLSQVDAAGALPVIPWGFGKWLGARGALLARQLESGVSSPFFLGDNGGRPWFWPEPAPFRRAAHKRIAVLPGSDPLPFASEATRAGGHGFRLRAPFEPERPAASLKSALRRADTAIEAFGRREGALRFARNQLRMQIHKRLRSQRGRA